MNRNVLQNIIEEFDPEKFVRFFREKNRSFAPRREDLTEYNDENFKDGLKLGEIKFADNEQVTVGVFRAMRSLSEKSGKKAQYEKGKKVLKDGQYDAGIFIFYDEDSSFRFSLIYANYLGRKRDWSVFRRFTYFVSKELTNKTFLQRIGDSDFSSLEKIKDAFSVEKVTKDFYKDIANWYFWAARHSKFPKDAKAEEGGRNVVIIRLITRLIFIWFMRERGLVPRNLFKRDEVKRILKDLSSERSTYYKAILQNLFFATLSTKKNERQFRSEIKGHKGYNPDFGNQYVYRYHQFFSEPQKIKDYFAEIPFLNGGLFECLDDKDNRIYIDGFTATKKHQPDIPNFLFFSEERGADLNAEYGTKKKKYKVRGLIDTLSFYNFTIDENDPNDAEIALDPELLGRVFENLLASFNPETSTTARKATGSYYTPREIVDYMVTESLKEYFKTHLPEVRDIDEKLETLFSTGSDENPFGKSESKKLVKMVESVRIVDPAVGSGAFPMGALNKTVFILNKIDPGNELWKQVQLEAADTIPDPQVQRNTKKQIEEFFKDKNADYGRKLYLIQKCIYGVDIQQIAVEIAKLRFFISLLVDEKIDGKKENWGIEPLPNLDFKIMQGNSLISEFLGIDFDNGQAQQEQAGILFAEKEDNLIKEFEQKKVDFQNESEKDKKAKLKNEVEALMIRIFETKVRKQKADYFRQMDEIEKKYATLPNKKTREEIVVKEKQKLSKKTGFDLANIEKQLREFTSKNKTKSFFPWKLYFAEVFEKGGFDVVIGNPPYLRIYRENIDRKTVDYLKAHYESAYKKFDLYVVFMEKGINLSRNNGIISYIVPDKWLSQPYGTKIRNIVLSKTSILFLMDLTDIKVFESSTVDNYVFSFKKRSGSKDYFRVIRCDRNFQHSNFQIRKVKQSELKINEPFNLFIEEADLGIVEKIKSRSIELGNICYVNWGCRPTPKEKYVSNQKISDKYKPLVVGSNIGRYYISKNHRWVRYEKSMYNPMFKELFENETIMLKDIIGKGNIVAGLNDKDYYSDFTVINIVKWSKISRLKLRHAKIPKGFEEYNYLDNRYLLSVINSKATSFYFNKLMRSGLHVLPNNVKRLPIPIAKEDEQKPFIDLVDKILAITKDDDYLENPVKQAKVRGYEKQINQLVYKLYGLTPEEIKIVEGGK